MDQPEKAESSATILICSVAIGLVWIYMGLVPKLLCPETGEMEMMRGAGFFSGFEEVALSAIGMAELTFGVVVIFLRKRLIHMLSIAGLICLAVGALLGKSEVYTQPFSPFVITVPMVALSLIAIRNLKICPATRTAG